MGISSASPSSAIAPRSSPCRPRDNPMPHSFQRPRLPRHFYVWSEPPDSDGDEVLNFVSDRRRIKLKGHSFREFEQRVIPLLDGRHTVAEIEQQVADAF